MWLLLGQIFSFVLLVGTFIYVRSCGAIVRSIVPRSLASETGLLLRTVFYVGPTAIAGAVLYLANTRGDVIWISLTGVYLGGRRRLSQSSACRITQPGPAARWSGVPWITLFRVCHLRRAGKKQLS